MKRPEIHSLSSGLLPSATEFHRICETSHEVRPRASGFPVTAGGDFHPALRNMLLVFLLLFYLVNL